MSAELLLLCTSAEDDFSLRARAGELARALEAQPAPELGAFLEAARAPLGRERLALVAPGVEGLRQALSAYGAGERPLGLRRGAQLEGPRAAGAVWVFSGQGPQWWGMGRELLAADPAFRAALCEVDAELSRLGWLAAEQSSLLAELGRPEEDSRIAETRIAQPALFALQLGLAASLRARGQTPTATLGHSIGELAAAVTAGALSSREATRIVFWRSRAQEAVEGQGRLAAAGLGAAEARALLAAQPELKGRVELAADNGPRSVTFAGERAAIEALGARCGAEGIFWRVLDVSVPFHSFLMDPVADPFFQGLGEVERRASALPFFSSVHGRQIAGEALDARYWWASVRGEVRFYPALLELIAAGHERFLELSPEPVLRRGIREALREAGRRGAVIATLARADPEQRALLEALGALYLAGVCGGPDSLASPGAPDQIALGPSSEIPGARSPGADADPVGPGG